MLNTSPLVCCVVLFSKCWWGLEIESYYMLSCLVFGVEPSDGGYYQCIIVFCGYKRLSLLAIFANTKRDTRLHNTFREHNLSYITLNPRCLFFELTTTFTPRLDPAPPWCLQPVRFLQGGCKVDAWCWVLPADVWHEHDARHRPRQRRNLEVHGKQLRAQGGVGWGGN